MKNSKNLGISNTNWTGTVFDLLPIGWVWVCLQIKPWLLDLLDFMDLWIDGDLLIVKVKLFYQVRQARLSHSLLKRVNSPGAWSLVPCHILLNWRGFVPIAATDPQARSLIYQVILFRNRIDLNEFCLESLNRASNWVWIAATPNCWITGS